MLRSRLTEAAIDALRPGGKTELIWEQGTGFGVTLGADGRASFVVRITVKPEAAASYNRRVTIGRANGPQRLSLKDARAEASRLRIEASEGRDPSKRLAKREVIAVAERRAADNAARIAEAENANRRRMT